MIRDAGPDSWGQHAIMRRVLGPDVRDRDHNKDPFLTYLLESGSNRPGALDFQRSATDVSPASIRLISAPSSQPPMMFKRVQRWIRMFRRL